MKSLRQPNPNVLHKVIRPLVHLMCALPLLALLYQGATSNLGVNPIEYLTHETGQWSLRFLLLTLLVTPLINVTRMNWLVLMRRPLGLYAFFYMFLHLCIYAVLDQGLGLEYIVADIVDRPYITAGLVGFLLCVPLAITSTKKMRRRLGKNWQRLHKLVYPIAILGVVHLVWLTRADYSESWFYGSILAFLLVLRIPSLSTKRKLFKKMPRPLS